MNGLRVAAMALLFPVTAVFASALVRFPLDALGVGAEVTKLVGILTFASALLLQYGVAARVRDRRAQE